MFSLRTSWDLSPNALTRAIDRLQAAHRPFIDLTESNPTSVSLDYPVDEILAAIADPRSLLYQPKPFGLPIAREAVAQSFHAQGIHLNPDRLVLTASSSESYSYLLKLLCDAGDSVLVPRPSYPLFDDLGRLEGVRIKEYGLFYDGRWQLDADSLRAAIDQRTRAVFVVSPNNPTGSYLLKQELEVIEQIAQTHDLAVVSDEVFQDYVWRDDPSRVRCVAESCSVLSFTLGGLSKSACLPQMKLGWIAVGGPPKDQHHALARLEMIADSYLSVGTPIQHAASHLLGISAVVQHQLRDRILANLKALCDLVRAPSALSLLRVDAGWYAILRIPNIMSDEQWAVQLLESDGVRVYPGCFFGLQSDRYLVISLIPPLDDFIEGIRRIAERVAQLCG